MGGTAFTLAAFENPYGWKFALTSALATFGGKFSLGLLPTWIKNDSTAGQPGLELVRSRGWIAAGLVATVLLFGVLGPSISL